MGATKKTARLAGLLYLMVVITGAFSLMYVTGKLAVQGTAAETTANLLAHQSLARSDVAIGLISSLLFLFVALVLYQLLKDVDRPMAALMAILVVIQIPQSFVSQLLELSALELARGSGPLSTIGQAQRDSLAVLFLHMNSKCVLLSELLWGLWLFPLGALVYRSGFIPRILGIWLLINGVAYVAQFGTDLFIPGFSGTLVKIAFPAILGEVALMLWLLIVGIRPRPMIQTGMAGSASQ